MNHAPLMKAAAIVLVLFGLPLMVAPNALLALYNAPELNGPGIYNSMTYGATLVALGVMNWKGAAMDRGAVAPIVLGMAIGESLCLCVALYRQLVDPTIPQSAWLNVVIFAVFAVLFIRVHLSLAGTAATAPAT